MRRRDFIHRMAVASGALAWPGCAAGRDEALRDRFDVGLSRALAKSPVACEYVLPFVKTGGRYLMWTGPTFSEKSVETALDVLGGEIIRRHGYSLESEESSLCIVEIRKRGATPAAFPRRPGVARKRPLLQGE